jgi:hypothetical protein
MNNVMRALQKDHPDAVFWIYSDDALENLYSELNNSTNVRVFGNSDLLYALYRIFNADALVISGSALSRTAALIGHSGSPKVSSVLGCLKTRKNLKIRPYRDLFGCLNLRIEAS